MINHSLQIIVTLIIGLCLGINTANTGVFNKQAVNYQYYFPDAAITYSHISYGNYLVDFNVGVSGVTGGFIPGFNRDNSIISLASRSSLTTTSFNGFIIDDISSIINPSKLLNLNSDTDILEMHTYHLIQAICM